jgi:ABC-type multidrug transport system ATPase subunit
MLEYIAVLKGSKHDRENSIKQVLLATNLLTTARQKIKTYSKGMKQRLGIAQALLNPTSILILDEPTASLDPEERNKFRRLMATLGQSRLVLLSSSILTDIVCANTAVILHHGRCRFTGTPAALATYGKQTAVTEINEQEAFTSSLQRGYRAVLSRVKQE